MSKNIGQEFCPLVSIIIPVYNGANFVKEAINSALSQTYRNIEVIVVNDGSTDDGNTDKVVREYGDQIRYYVKENGGVSTALNLGIKVMKGEYFSWLSHDDKYSPDKIEKQIATLSKLNDREVVCLANSEQIDSNSKLIKNGKGKKLFNDGIVKWNQVLLSLFKNGTFNGCALLIPKRVFTVCGVFNEVLRFNQDTFMWINICLSRFSFCYEDYVGVYMRVHNGQLTKRGQTIFHSDCLIMSNVLIDKLSDISTKKQNFLYEYAKNNAKYNNSRVVNMCIDKAKNTKLFSVFNVIWLRCIGFYGKVRPVLKKVYDKLLKDIKN